MTASPTGAERHHLARLVLGGLGSALRLLQLQHALVLELLATHLEGVLAVGHAACGALGLPLGVQALQLGQLGIGGGPRSGGLFGCARLLGGLFGSARRVGGQHGLVRRHLGGDPCTPRHVHLDGGDLLATRRVRGGDAVRALADAQRLADARAGERAAVQQQHSPLRQADGLEREPPTVAVHARAQGGGAGAQVTRRLGVRHEALDELVGFVELVQLHQRVGQVEEHGRARHHREHFMEDGRGGFPLRRVRERQALGEERPGCLDLGLGGLGRLLGTGRLGPDTRHEEETKAQEADLQEFSGFRVHEYGLHLRSEARCPNSLTF